MCYYLMIQNTIRPIIIDESESFTIILINQNIRYIGCI